MPFTLSHAAVLVPASRISGNKLFLISLAVGSMVPDFGYYFAPSSYFYLNSHNLVRSLTFCLPVGIVSLFFFLILKNGWSKLFPLRIRPVLLGFIPATLPRSGMELTTMAFSILLGAWSHIFWDAWTHRAGYFVKAFPIMSEKTFIFGLEVFRILQHLSSLLGLLALCYWFFIRVRSIRVVVNPCFKITPRTLFWIVSLFLSIAFALRTIHAESRAPTWVINNRLGFVLLTLSMRNWIILILFSSFILQLSSKSEHNSVA